MYFKKDYQSRKESQIEGAKALLLKKLKTQAKNVYPHNQIYQLRQGKIEIMLYLNNKQPNSNQKLTNFNQSQIKNQPKYQICKI